MINPKFSIAIPAYKSTFLEEAIESCLAQEYSNFEIVIVNDASPEDLDTIVSHFPDERVRYFKNERNCGIIDVVDNWNKCLEYATGDYIICMGDDDRLLPCCLTEYVRLIEKFPDTKLFHGWTEIIDENSSMLKVTHSRIEYESVFSMMWHRWEGRSHFIGDWCFETKNLRSKGGFYKLPLAWASDEVSTFLAAADGGVANSQKLCFQYRINSRTISNSGNERLKIAAYIKEKEWVNSFICGINFESLSDLDKKFYKCLLTRTEKHFHYVFMYEISKELERNIFSCFFWLKKARELNLKKRTILNKTLTLIVDKFK